MIFVFAKCKCAHLTPIRPATPVIPGVNPQPTETDDEPVVVACSHCKRVLEFDSDTLVRYPTGEGFAPYNPDAPMKVFRVPLKCDELNCEAQLLVHVVLPTNTTAAALEKEKASWKLAGLECPECGHEFPWPPYHEG